MRTFIFQILFFFLPVTALLAQVNDTIYLDKARRKAGSKTNAAYFAVTSYKDATKTEGTKKTYFITGEKEEENNFTVERTADFERIHYFGTYTKWYKNGQMQMQINYQEDKKEGPETRWYEDGQLYNITPFNKGNRQGEAITYYPDGKLKRKEIFAGDLLIEGKCLTRAGSDTIYYPIEEIPVFPGGETALLTFIKKNVKYNKKALRNGIQGLVLVQFVVDKTGSISDVEVVKKLSPALDAESVRVVNLMPQGWQPGRQEGKPISFRFTLPIRFAFE